MVNRTVVGIGVVIIVAFYVTFFFIFPTVFKISIDTLSYPLVLVAILLAGIFIGISGFLPYGWGKFLRYIAYFCLFILILVLELNVFKTYFEKYPSQEITLEKCTTLFGKKEKPEGVMDAVGIWSCVTTGYFPSEQAELGWTMFAIFYIILPFAFIWALLYGLMTGVGLDELFGNFGKPATTLLSFIISMYAARQLFGFFLLDMFGFGAWGLAGVFGAALFVLTIRHMIEKWFAIEAWTAQVEDAIKTALNREKNAKKALVIYLNSIKGKPNQDALTDLLSIKTAGSMAYPAYIALTSTTQSQVEQRINQATPANVKQIINDLINLLK